MCQIKCDLEVLQSSITLNIVLAFAFSVVLGVSIGVFCALGYQRCRRSVKSSPQTEIELQTATTAEYEEPENFIPDPNTQGNVAYEHVQFSH